MYNMITFFSPYILKYTIKNQYIHHFVQGLKLKSEIKYYKFERQKLKINYIKKIVNFFFHYILKYTIKNKNKK